MYYKMDNSSEGKEVNLDEIGDMVDILNIYTIYYNETYKRKGENIMKGVNKDDPTSTNIEMEYLYEEFQRYSKDVDRESVMYDVSLYESDKDDYDRTYIVKYEDENMVAHNLVICLYYLKDKDWKNRSWSIVQMKMQ